MTTKELSAAALFKAALMVAAGQTFPLSTPSAPFNGIERMRLVERIPPKPKRKLKPKTTAQIAKSKKRKAARQARKLNRSKAR